MIVTSLSTIVFFFHFLLAFTSTNTTTNPTNKDDMVCVVQNPWHRSDFCVTGSLWGESTNGRRCEVLMFSLLLAWTTSKPLSKLEHGLLDKTIWYDDLSMGVPSEEMFKGYQRKLRLIHITYYVTITSTCIYVQGSIFENSISSVINMG